MPTKNYVRSFSDLRITDVPDVGGKNASLGEMIANLTPKGIAIPPGFATTSAAYWDFLDKNNLREAIAAKINELEQDPNQLERIGSEIRSFILEATFPKELSDQITKAYRALIKECGATRLAVAVRSSATAEDLPQASFAGQQETYLNIKGHQELLEACKKCFASLFTDRAITYRKEKGFDHLQVALSVGVQKMVRSDKGSAGVLFTVDTETGFPNMIIINGAYGLGENVVQGTVIPDEYLVFKPLLDQKQYSPIIEKVCGAKEKKMILSRNTVANVSTKRKERSQFVLENEEILHLSRFACIIEEHYGKPMDIEWAKDGVTGELFIVQARPETVQSQKTGESFFTYTLQERAEPLITGLAIGDAIAAGKAQVIKSVDNISEFIPGSILVTELTTPDWVPIMKKASGIVTDHGGRTSHAAIMSRELNVPAVVGTGKGTENIMNEQEITLSCAEGDQGFIYNGILRYEQKEICLKSIPDIPVDIMINVASPAAALRWWRLPCKGIGLARMEFIVDHIIKIHPMALVHPERVKGRNVKRTIDKLTERYEDPKEYFIDLLSQGIARISASQYPNPVIVRTSDFKTNEYANLIGGENFEPHEENPLLGFRGASRYYSDAYREAFVLECLSLKRVRETYGLTNLVIMIPFCRTIEEADRVLAIMAEHGLKRGENGLEIYVMAEIPSNIILAEEFADRFDGFSIGSNDLTQLILGIDRDAENLAHIFDERNPAVKESIQDLITIAHKKGRKVGICGQGPSDHVDFAQFLITSGIDSISLNPDSVISTLQSLNPIIE